MKKFQVRVNDKQYVVEVEELGAETNHVAETKPAPTPVVAAPEPAAAPVAQGVAEGLEVKAPLRGQIVRVAVKPGDTIARGQVLLTIEALKMENEIAAPVAGQVTGVFTQAGTVVDAGALLVTIKERDS